MRVKAAGQTPCADAHEGQLEGDAVGTPPMNNKLEDER